MSNVSSSAATFCRIKSNQFINFYSAPKHPTHLFQHLHVVQRFRRQLAFPINQIILPLNLSAVQRLELLHHILERVIDERDLIALEEQQVKDRRKETAQCGAGDDARGKFDVDGLLCVLRG